MGDKLGHVLSPETGAVPLLQRPADPGVRPYVARPTPEATVSLPVEWDELDSQLCPVLFTVETAPVRLRERGGLSRGLLEGTGDLAAVIDRLDGYVKGRRRANRAGSCHRGTGHPALWAPRPVASMPVAPVLSATPSYSLRFPRAP